MKNLIRYRPDPDGGSGGGGGTTPPAPAADPPGQEPNAAPGGQVDPGQDPGDQTEIQRTRAEAAKYRRELREAQNAVAQLQSRVEQFEGQGQSEQQRWEAERDRLRNAETEATRRAIAAEVRADAYQIGRRLNIVDTDSAVRLLPDDLDRDADGRPTDLEGAMKQLVHDKPWLVQRQGGGSPGHPGGQQGGQDPAAQAAPGLDRIRAALAANAGQRT